MADLVSVVIPTRGRPELLERALRSALAQTHRPIEIVVVVDGPDAETVALLRSMAEDRIRMIENPTPLGGPAARNVGIRAARGEWIALLDDDDEWLPAKLERQLALLASVEQPAVASCRIITRTPHAEWVGPRRGPREGEHLSDYLFRPRLPFARGARLQTSALFVPRQIALDVPWDESLRRFQDFDWMLRAAATGIRFVIVPEALSVWYFREERPSIGTDHARDWRQALEWIDERRHLVTKRAYARWVLGRVGGLAAAARDRPQMKQLWRTARANGRPGLIDVLQFAFHVLSSARLPRALQARLATARRARGAE